MQASPQWGAAHDKAGRGPPPTTRAILRPFPVVPPAASPLEGVPRDEWVVFDNVLIIRDVFTGGKRSFASQGDAHEFRAAVYAHYGAPRQGGAQLERCSWGPLRPLGGAGTSRERVGKGGGAPQRALHSTCALGLPHPQRPNPETLAPIHHLPRILSVRLPLLLTHAVAGLPKPTKPRRVPRTITFQRKRANRRVINEAALLELLGSYAPVRCAPASASSSRRAKK